MAVTPRLRNVLLRGYCGLSDTGNNTYASNICDAISGGVMEESAAETRVVPQREGH
jgi:hypothetical protein